ncbi:flagellar biosynthesis protein FliZ [Borrelia sp. RT5S]|uniref:flagellar biosynthesis protein FliZ n=1 Tax=Borrelia sp. RT5S TaxID=2898581 RepID=UPI001E2ABED7|nr:flagellar biosynthesis protein FliZ [Borrelia sp. RT5S]UGQ15969.1 flagellar biosynthesis protein FliZ [Borrelia sp. RT5S]
MIKSLFKFLILVFILFSGGLFAQEEGVGSDVVFSGLENEADLPIFEDNETRSSGDSIQDISLFNITDLVKILLFLSFFVFCVLIFKRVIFSRRRVVSNRKSDFIKELAFYEIDTKSSIRIISVLGNVYVFLVSSSSSVLLREIRQGEEINDLEPEFVKDEDLRDKNSFSTIFNRILKTGKDDEELLDKADYTELEKDIETSLKSKQDRLKKF